MFVVFTLVVVYFFSCCCMDTRGVFIFLFLDWIVASRGYCIFFLAFLVFWALSLVYFFSCLLYGHTDLCIYVFLVWCVVIRGNFILQSGLCISLKLAWFEKRYIRVCKNIVTLKGFLMGIHRL